MKPCGIFFGTAEPQRLHKKSCKKIIFFFLKSQCSHPVGGKKQAKMVSMLSKFKLGLCPSCPPLRIYYLSFYVQLSRNKKWIKTNRPDCVPII